MTAMVLPVRRRPSVDKEFEASIEVNVFLQARVMAPEKALQKANVWLSMNAGHLLLVENPELVLGDPLQWRFRVVRTVPRQDKAGSVRRDEIGQLQMNAITGEILESEPLIQRLIATAHALTERSA